MIMIIIMLKKFGMCLKYKMWGNIIIYTFKLIHYCLPMCLETLEINASKHMSLIHYIIYLQGCLKKTGVELELLTDIDKLLMVEERIRGGICQVPQRYSKTNNKYMKDFDKNRESAYIQYFDANNLYGWAMSQPLPVSGFKWVNNKSKFTTDFTLNYDVYSDVRYIFEATTRYLKKYMVNTKIYHLYIKKKRLINIKNSYVV